MKIAFVATQSLLGSTVVGRVLPLAEELGKRHEIHVLVHKGGSHIPYSKFHIQYSGSDPFLRTPSGKLRQSGLRLAFTMLTNALNSAFVLVRLKPDVIIIVKSLPENVLAVWLAKTFLKLKKIVLDVDDFELTAQVLTSLTQRAAIHWAERVGAKMSDHIVTATPFLSDHFEQLTQGKKPLTMIPTGLSPLYTPDVYKDVHIGSGLPALMYAGSLSLSSGHRIDLVPKILTEVRKQYPEIELHVYGTGDDEKLLKNREGIVLHGRFNLNAAETNFATPEEQPAGSTSGVILLDPIDSSISNRAKSSFRVALAAALGLPVVTSDIGIRPYLLPDEIQSRCFARPGDAKDYAEKVVSFIKRPLSEQERRALRMHGQQFTWVHLGEKYAKVIASK